MLTSVKERFAATKHTHTHTHKHLHLNPPRQFSISAPSWHVPHNICGKKEKGNSVFGDNCEITWDGGKLED